MVIFTFTNIKLTLKKTKNSNVKIINFKIESAEIFNGKSVLFVEEF